jgi:hypothetical protein
VTIYLSLCLWQQQQQQQQQQQLHQQQQQQQQGWAFSGSNSRWYNTCSSMAAFAAAEEQGHLNKTSAVM